MISISSMYIYDYNVGIWLQYTYTITMYIYDYNVDVIWRQICECGFIFKISITLSILD